MKYVNIQIKVALLMAIIIVFAPTIINADENEWTSNGPEGGTVYSIAVNPENPNNLFIGTITDGLYRSYDSGGNWQHIDENSFNNTMREITFHPLGPDTIFVSSISGLFKSTNNGNNWEKLYPIGSESEVYTFLIHPVDPNLIFIGEYFYTSISHDGGQTWDEADLPPWQGLVDFAVSYNNPDIIYGLNSSFIYEMGIWKSSDRGETWENIQNNIDSVGWGQSIAIDPVDSDILYIGLVNRVSTVCLYKSIDGGDSWVDISPDSLTIYQINSVKIMPGDHNTIFICTLSDGVLKSIDGGQTWQPANNGLKYLNTIDIVFDPLNNIIYLATINDGVYRSSNGGCNWERISTNIKSLETDEISVNYFNPNEAIAATAIGLYRTANLGQTWEALDIGCPDHHIPMAIVYDILDSNRCYTATDNYDDYNSVHDDGFYRSLDGGDTWEYFNEGLPNDINSPLMAISYTDDAERIILLTTYDDGLYLSYDDGEHWSHCDDDSFTDIIITTIAVAPSDQEIIAVGGSGNRVYLSQDRGITWEQIASLPYHSSGYIQTLVFDPSNADHIFASCPRFGLYESINAGESWSCINNDLPVNEDYININSIAINPENRQNIFAASEDYGIYQTHNGGQNWEPFNAGIDTADGIGDLAIAPSDTTKLYFASGNRSVWSITRTATGVDDNDIIALPSSVNLSAYPNPFNAATRITFNINAAGNVKADIYDVLGRHVANIVNDYLYPGYHSIVWKPEAVSTGQYYLKLDDGNVISSQKMLYIK